METFYEVMRQHGISRRSFLKYCSLTATSLGLGPAFVPQIAHAMENKPRTPVVWISGLECTCCSESFIRSAHPLAKDVVLSMISLDYNEVLMAAAGHQAEAAIEEARKKHKGNYILAVEGNPPLNQEFDTRYDALPLPKSNLTQGLTVLGSASDPYSGTNIRLWDPNIRPAAVLQWNFSIQQLLTSSTTLQVGYVGQKNTHLMVPMPYAQKMLNANGTVSPTKAIPSGMMQPALRPQARRATFFSTVPAATPSR